MGGSRRSRSADTRQSFHLAPRPRPLAYVTIRARRRTVMANLAASGSTSTRPNPWLYWGSWVITAMPVFVVLTSGRWKLTHAATYVAEFNSVGWPTERLELLAFLQLTAI